MTTVLNLFLYYITGFIFLRFGIQYSIKVWVFWFVSFVLFYVLFSENTFLTNSVKNSVEPCSHSQCFINHPVQKKKKKNQTSLHTSLVAVYPLFSITSFKFYPKNTGYVCPHSKTWLINANVQESEIWSLAFWENHMVKHLQISLTKSWQPNKLLDIT